MNLAAIDNIPQPPSIKLIRPLADFEPLTIEIWISKLPLTDVDYACEAMHGLLRTVNVTDGLECLERFRIAEQIRPPTVSLLAMSSEKHLPADTLFPLPPGQHKHTQRNVEMSLELANAYRRVVTSGTFFSEKILTEADRAQTVYRALQAYGLTLLRSLEQYESPPEGFWREVYAFYRFAEGHNLHKFNLPYPEIEGATIDSQFKQMLLLALSSHQHHTPNEIRQFYTALMLIARDAEIHDSQQLGEETALFYFDSRSDNAPRPVSRAKSGAKSGRRFLFTAPMLDKARHYFSNPAHRATDRFKLRAEVIMLLLETLSASDKRRFVRKPATGMRLFVVGLPRLLDEFSGDGPLPLPVPIPLESEQAEAQPATDDFDDEGEIVLEDKNRERIWGRGGNPADEDEPDDAMEQAGSAQVEGTALTGELVNISVGGYCMVWKNSSVAGARIGELIGIYEDDGIIHLGTIRWLHYKAKAELALGVQLLPSEVEVVGIEVGREGGEVAHRGFYLRANPKLGQPASLLCAPGVFKPGQSVTLRGKKTGRLPFALESILNSTLSFQLFSLATPS